MSSLRHRRQPGFTAFLAQPWKDPEFALETRTLGNRRLVLALGTCVAVVELVTFGRVVRLCLPGLLCASAVEAKICLLASEPSAVERVVVIESFGDPARASWLSVETRGDTRIAWLVGDGDVLAIEPQGGSFLATLERETTPTVAAMSELECDRAPATPIAERPRIEASGAPTLGVGDWSAKLARFAVRPEDCELEEPVRAVLFDMPDRAASTAVLRVAGERNLALRSNFEAFVTFLSFGAGRARWPLTPELAAHDLELTYFLADHRNDYRRTRDAWLASVSGAASVLESVVPLENAPARTDAERLPLFAAYYRNSEVKDAAPCLSLLRVSADVLTHEPFSSACPLPRAPAAGFPALPECVESMGGMLGAGTARCERADDFALAVSGLTLANARLTRSFVRLPAGVEREPSFEFGGDAPIALTPARIDSSGCVPREQYPVPITNPPPVKPIYETDEPPYRGSGPEVTIYVDGGDSCSGDSGSDSCSGDSSSSSEGDSCSGDSSSSSEDDSCSGDSSSSSEDDSCSGDSSSSSEDDSCSGDSSSSSEDDSCSGDSSSSDEDESCFGNAKPTSARPSARPGASIAAESKGRGRPHRSRLSVWTIAISAVWLPIRRLGRAPKLPLRR